MTMADETSKFSKVLSSKDILALAFGAMIGWGWVVLAGGWVSRAGSLGAIIAFALGGLMVIFVGLTYAELTAAMPKCGGEHVFSHRALGHNMSFVCTWAIVLGYVSVVAFEAVALPTVIEYLFPNYKQGFMYSVAGWDVYLTWVLVGMLASIAITVLNYFGVKPAALVQGVVTIMIALVGIAFLGGALTNGDSANLTPLFIDGTKGIFAVAIMTPFMYVGFDVIPQAAEEINMEPRNIGRILLLSVVMAVVWYAAIILGVSLALDHAGLQGAQLATADSMQAVFSSPLAAKVMILAGIGGILTSWNSFFVGGSRAIYAMAASGMLPPFLSFLHPKYKTPTNAILMIGLFSSLAPLCGRKMLVWLVDAGGLAIVISYFLVALSFLVLRHREPEMERPYLIKAGKTVGVIAMILSFGMALLYMPGAPAALLWPYEWLIFLGWWLLGGVFLAWAKLAGGNARLARNLEQDPLAELD
jgi:amino acid transporter